MNGIYAQSKMNTDTYCVEGVNLTYGSCHTSWDDFEKRKTKVNFGFSFNFLFRMPHRKLKYLKP